MNSNDSNIYEVIEQYLSGTLPSSLKTQFEELLKTDSTLQHKLEICKAAKNAILQNKLKGLKSIMAEEQSKADKGKPFNKMWALAIVAAMLCTGSYFYFSNKENNKSEIALQNENRTEKPKENVADASDKALQVESTNNTNPQSTKPAISQQNDKGQATLPVENTTEKQADKTTTESVKDATHNYPVEAHNDDNSKGKPTPEPVTDPCKGVKISADLSMHEPCSGDHDGFIELKDLHGGKAPYKLALNGGEHQTEHIYKELRPGNYHIEVTDNNGCKHQFNNLILKGKDCVLKYDFNPGHGEEWQGPVVQASRLTIMDKNGKVVYSRNMNEGEQCTWNGYNQAGALVHGYFVFIIENTDGTVTKGTITVTE